MSYAPLGLGGLTKYADTDAFVQFADQKCVCNMDMRACQCTPSDPKGGPFYQILEKYKALSPEKRKYLIAFHKSSDQYPFWKWQKLYDWLDASAAVTQEDKPLLDFFARASVITPAEAKDPKGVGKSRFYPLVPLWMALTPAQRLRARSTVQTSPRYAGMATEYLVLFKALDAAVTGFRVTYPVAPARTPSPPVATAKTGFTFKLTGGPAQAEQAETTSESIQSQDEKSSSSWVVGMVAALGLGVAVWFLTTPPRKS